MTKDSPALAAERAEGPTPRTDAATIDKADYYRVPEASGGVTQWVADCDYEEMRDLSRQLERELARVREDAERWQWAKDILAGDDEQVTNSKTLFVAAGLMRGEAIDQIVATAIRALPPAAKG